MVLQLTWIIRFWILFTFISFCKGLEIIDSPPDSIWIREGESVNFSCQSDEPWQWCYWEILPIDGATNQTSKTQRFQAYQGSSSNINPSMRFKVNSTTCGLEIQSATHGAHNGRWKCHLADTDKDEVKEIKAEAYVNLNVAIEANPILTAKLTEKGINLNYQEKQLVGSLLTLSCTTQQAKVYPLPELNLWLVSGDGKSKDLLAKSNTDGKDARLDLFELTKNDLGKYFMCESSQKAFLPDQTKPELLFNNYKSGDAIQLVYPPMLEVTSHPPYVYVNESFIIQIPISARPVPDEDQLVWSVMPQFGNGTTTETVLLSVSNRETESFRFYSLQPTKTSDEYIATIGILNLTTNVQITLTAWNDYGELKHSFPVIFTPPLPDPNESVDVSAAEAGIALWVIILIAVIAIVILLVAFCGLVWMKGRKDKKIRIESRGDLGEIESHSWSRKKPGDAGSTPMNPHDVRKVRGKEKRNGVRPMTDGVDLDQIPDNQLPMLEKIYSDQHGTTPFLHRSMSDERSSSIETDSRDVVDNRKTNDERQNNSVPEPGEEEEEEEEDFFNEQLLDIQNTDPDILGSMENLEPGLVVRQDPDGGNHIIEDQRFFDAPPDQVVMTTGPTSYPVVTSPTSKMSYFPSPSYIPGRRTSQLDFLHQNEPPKPNHTNSLGKGNTFSRR